MKVSTNPTTLNRKVTMTAEEYSVFSYLMKHISNVFYKYDDAYHANYKDFHPVLYVNEYKAFQQIIKDL